MTDDRDRRAADPTPANARALAEEAIRLAEAATPGPWRWVGMTLENGAYDDVIALETKGSPWMEYQEIAMENRDADQPLIAHAGTHYGTLARAYLALVSDLPVVIEAAERDAQLAEDEAFYERDDPGGDVAEADFLCERAKEVRAACERLRALGGGSP